MTKSIVKVACASGHCAVDANLLFTPRSTHHYHKNFVVHLEMFARPVAVGALSAEVRWACCNFLSTQDHAAAKIAKAGASTVLRGG